MHKMHRIFGEKIAGAVYYNRPGAYLVDYRAGSLAVVRNSRGMYLPGGGIKPRESREEALRRECLEETGRSVKLQCYLGCGESFLIHKKIGYYHPIQHYYIGTLGKMLVEPTEKGERFYFLPWAEAKTKLKLDSQIWAVEQAIAYSAQ